MKTRDRELANRLCNWWAENDPESFYYVTGRETMYYAPRADLEALGIPSELDWEKVWPELWPAE